MDPQSLDAGAAWMLELQRGDTEAFERIVQEYQHLVHHLCFRFTGRRDLVEDLAQEVFLRVYRARERYRPEAKFRTWVFRIVYNLCINETKARRTKRLPSLEAPMGGEEDLTLRNIVGDPEGLRPPEEVVREEAKARLRRALAELPPQQRAAMTLYQYRGLSLREIADAMGTSEKAVKSLLARARENLREKLAHYFGLPVFEMTDRTENPQ